MSGILSHRLRFRADSCRTSRASLAASTRIEVGQACIQGRLGGLAIEERAEEEAGEEVAGAVRNLGTARAQALDALGRAYQKGGNAAGRLRGRGDQDRRGAEPARGLGHLVQALRAAAGQPLQLEQVGRGDGGERDERVAHGLRRLDRNIEAVVVAEDRIDADHGPRIGGLDAGDGLRRSRDRSSRGKIAGEDGIEHRPAAVGLQRGQHAGEVGRRQLEPRQAAEAGAAREQHRRQRPDLVAEVLQRRHGRVEADVAPHDMG